MVAFETVTENGPKPGIAFGRTQDNSKITIASRASASEVLSHTPYSFCRFLWVRYYRLIITEKMP
jgi:hypothetical protein